jgi:hypothetical protein
VVRYFADKRLFDRRIDSTPIWNKGSEKGWISAASYGSALKCVFGPKWEHVEISPESNISGHRSSRKYLKTSFVVAVNAMRPIRGSRRFIPGRIGTCSLYSLDCYVYSIENGEWR